MTCKDTNGSVNGLTRYVRSLNSKYEHEIEANKRVNEYKCILILANQSSILKSLINHLNIQLHRKAYAVQSLTFMNTEVQAYTVSCTMSVLYSM